jgi:hypothetical protein
MLKIMAATKFKTQFNGLKSNSDYEKPTGLSMTQPDMAMSMREMLRKHAAGVDISVGRVPIWSEHPSWDTYDETIGDFDLVDAQNLAETMQARLETIRKQQRQVAGNEADSLEAKIEEMTSYIKELETAEDITTIDQLRKKRIKELEAKTEGSKK